MKYINIRAIIRDLDNDLIEECVEEICIEMQSVMKNDIVNLIKNENRAIIWGMQITPITSNNMKDEIERISKLLVNYNIQTILDASRTNLKEWCEKNIIIQKN